MYELSAEGYQQFIEDNPPKTPDIETTDFGEYDQIHKWLQRKYGKADRCLNIACPGRSDKFQWALKHDCKHEKKLENYIQLCVSCHINYDKAPKGWRKIKGRVISVRLSEEDHKDLKRTSLKEGKTVSKIINELIKQFNKTNNEIEN